MQSPTVNAFSLAALLFALTFPAARAQSLPSGLAGSWRITRILPTSNPGCWDTASAKALVGTTLRYRQRSIRYRGTEYSFTEALSRTLSRRKYLDEYKVDLSELGIRAPSVTEVDLQHEDADITGATTEVPGDTIVFAGLPRLPERIVVSACGVFYEAVRAGAARPGTH